MRIIKHNIDEDVEVISTLSFDEDGHNNDISYNTFDYEYIFNNRQNLCKLLDTDFDHCVAPSQTHSKNLQLVGVKDGGKGIYKKETAFTNTDALYSKDNNLWLWSFHADCCPVMIYAKDKHIIASIHSGWKGTVTEISKAVVQELMNKEGCNPKYMKVFVGPTINQDNFEAMDDIIHQVNNMSFDSSSFYKSKDETHYLLDHKGLIKATLLSCGILEENITVSEIDTYKDERFFSYRKDKVPYRNITAIKMK